MEIKSECEWAFELMNAKIFRGGPFRALTADIYPLNYAKNENDAEKSFSATCIQLLGYYACYDQI